MQPNQQPQAAEHFVNELPPRYSSWLHLYDSINEEFRSKEDGFMILERLDETQYYQLFHKMPAQLDITRQVEISYRIERDFMLARVAELLLPARLNKSEIDKLRAKARLAESFEAHAAYMDAAKVLEPLWMVALNK